MELLTTLPIRNIYKVILKSKGNKIKKITKIWGRTLLDTRQVVITFFECSVVPLEYYPWNDNSSSNKYSRDIMDHLFFLLWLCHLITARKQSCGKVLLFTGGLCAEGSLSRGVSVLGGSLSWGLCPGVSLSRGVSLQGVFLLGNHQGSLLWGSLSSVSVPEGSLSCWVSIQGHLCPGGLCPGGSLSLGGLQRVSVLGVSVQGGLCPGGSLSGRPPPDGKERRYASYWNVF